MNILHRVSAGVLTLAMLIQPVAGLAADLTFSEPVVVNERSTPADILKQSDQYTDGVLTVGGREFVIDKHGHAVLRQPDKGWLCSWFGWWCPELMTGEIAVGQQRAKERVIAQVISSIHAEMVRDTGRVLPLLAFAYPQPLPAGTVVYQVRRENVPVNVINDSWFFFLDLEPDAFFDHRAEFVLVDAKTGAIRRERVFTAPVLDGKVRYFDLNERWTTPDRFYPADIADLPPAGDWPMQFNDADAGNRPLQPPPDLKPPMDAPAAHAPQSLYDVPWLLPVAEAASAPATSSEADPCAGKPRKKVAVTIAGEGPNTKHNDGFVDGEIIGNSEQNMVDMFIGMGVARRDIHRFNPEKTPKLEDVFKQIDNITKDLGPCDKFFFYVFGHGTITDKDGDHLPDSPSSGIAYGHGEDAEYMGKDRWSTHSLITLLESVRAQDINVIIESCYSGSIRNWIATDTGNPAAGSTWHIFLASGGLKPSYGHRHPDQGKPGAYYSDAMAACVSKKLAERGLTNPTIEQIEQVMRECQHEFNDNPTRLLSPPPVEDVIHVTYTVSPNVRIVEGDSGVKHAEFTITRSPAIDDGVFVGYSTYDPDPDGDVSNYAGPKDYEWNKEGKQAYFEPGEASVTIRIPVYGDTLPEEDETFGVWFSGITTVRIVTIVDDDRPVTVSDQSSSSSVPSAQPEGEYIIKLDPVTLGADYDLNGYAGYVIKETGGYTGKEYGTITLTFAEDAMIEEKTVIDAECPACEELAEQAMLQADICALLEQDLADAQAALDDLDRQIASAEKDVKAAEDALNAFNNPKSSASADGRTTDSSDLQAGREWAAGLWAQYKAGGLTAQQLEQKWKDGMSDAERQKIKDDIRARLEAGVAAAKARVEKLKADRTAAADALAELRADVDLCNEELDRLIDAWMACELSCVEPDDDIGVIPGDSLGSTSSSASSGTPGTVPSSSSSSSSSSGPSVQPASSPSSSSSSSGLMTTPVSSSQPSSSRPSVAPASSSVSSSSSARPVNLCPNGTTPNRYECEEFCGHEGGTCADNQGNGCWSCTVAQCPAGTFTNTCPSSCFNGCDVVGQDGATQCLQCKQSCAEVCSGLGAQAGTNWNAYISSQLNQYTCVSGASVETETTTAGSCTCSTQPTVQVDTTVPVCKGTPCGDVVCGGSASCQQGEAMVTVSCNWGGWQNVGENQFKPIIGQ